MNQAMGQIEDPQEELSKGLDLANKYLEYTKEPEKARITNEIEFAREDPEGYRNFLQQKEALNITTKEKDAQMYIGMYNRKEISRDELMKLLGGYVPTNKLSDWEKKWNMFIKVYEDNNMEIPMDNALKILGAYVGDEETTDKVTTTEINLAEKQFSNVKTNAQYDTALATVRQTDKNVKVPAKEEVFIGNYNKAIKAIKAFIDNTGKIKEGDYKTGYSYVDVYKALYEDLETAIQEFQIATGQLLDNPFISFEEYEKSDVKEGKGLLYPSTWGQQKSVFKNIQTTEQIFGGTK
ncbi:MAG: hypothetical protein ACTSPO_15675 [Candidatus Heimdallarchaeaceae archaeon]